MRSERSAICTSVEPVSRSFLPNSRIRVFVRSFFPVTLSFLFFTLWFGPIWTLALRESKIRRTLANKANCSHDHPGLGRKQSRNPQNHPFQSFALCAVNLHFDFRFHPRFGLRQIALRRSGNNQSPKTEAISRAARVSTRACLSLS